MHPNDRNNPRTSRYEAGYGDQGYGDQGYGNQGYESRAYSQQPYPADKYGGHQEPVYSEPAYQEPRRAPRRRSNRPQVNPGVFAGGVLATAVVTGLAAWLVAWVVREIYNRINESGKYGVWNPMSRDEYWFAVVGVLCALAAGALWYVLQVSTPAPDQFFSWIVGLLIIAAIVLPLLLSREWHVGITTAIMHLVIGLPILFLIRAMGAKSLEYR